jgi:iron complex transport system ATP-binding protein
VSLGGTEVLHEVSAAVEPGEWVAVIGPNGAGKTTLLRSIASLVSFSGSIELLGDDLRSLPHRERARRVALVAQIPTMPAEMSVREYVLLGRTPYIGYLATERRSDHDAAEAAIDRLELGPFAKRRLSSLSGGERQRTVLARALAQDAPLLVLDEPTSALDPAGRRVVRVLLEELRGKGHSVLLNSHLLSEIELVCDRVAILRAGEVVAAGSPAELSQPRGVELERPLERDTCLGPRVRHAEPRAVVIVREAELAPGICVGEVAPCHRAPGSQAVGRRIPRGMIRAQLRPERRPLAGR